MYREIVTRRAEAYCHLFFHCCMGDESLVRRETAFTVAKYVEGGLNVNVDLTMKCTGTEFIAPTYIMSLTFSTTW